MPDDTQAQQLILNDGRRLAYAEQGAPTGHPVFFFHGAPGSRLLRHPDASINERLGVRLITVDRPGYGLSDPSPNRRLLDWPADVAQLADAIGIERFAVVGVSGGGPHAAACAYKLAGRITNVGLVSCPVPFAVPGMRESLAWGQRLQLSLGAKLPWAMSLMMGWYGRAAAKVTPDQAMQKLAQELPPLEVESVRQPKVIEMIIADTVEALRQGGSACAHELRLTVQPWGFRPEDLSMPVHLWQGDRDTNVSLVMGQYLARAIPNCRAVFCPGEGHLVALTHWEEIMRTMAQA